MMMNLSKLFVVIVLLVLLDPVHMGEGASMNRDLRMNTPEHWINKAEEPAAVIMSAQNISQYNAEVKRVLPTTIFDLRSYPAYLTAQSLTGLLQAAAMPQDTVYSKGVLVSDRYFDELNQQLNIGAVKDYNKVAYAFTIVRTNVRTFPTRLGIFDTASDREFDLFQETIINPGEPLIILHKSVNNEWGFIQSSNYRGWVLLDNLAVVRDRAEWVQYIDEQDFLVVTGSNVQLAGYHGTDAPLVFEMGAKLPLIRQADIGNEDHYIVKLPARDQLGELSFKQVSIPRSADVHVGYLPYTRANIISQAFKYYGQPYGWGGMHDSVDCSSFIMNVYRSFGFELPRNADEQEVNVGSVFQLKNNSRARIAQLSFLQPGAALHMNGHVMLYLGQENGKRYAIHSLASYTERLDDGSFKRVRPMKVVVSDLNLLRGNGRTFEDSLTVVKNVNW
ncbi:hypothetical protein SDC9_13711 [bioreactor metagenome]|uniref:NlpC/P60 domain-containing protein n=1 Tax=bioreactor metagenome TaxID=1076179 RepID=A0A644TNL1_9ZZZZ|nr:SH3 domain-containing protein [Negativicutes bacterium]